MRLPAKVHRTGRHAHRAKKIAWLRHGDRQASIRNACVQAGRERHASAAASARAFADKILCGASMKTEAARARFRASKHGEAHARRA